MKSNKRKDEVGYVSPRNTFGSEETDEVNEVQGGHWPKKNCR